MKLAIISDSHDNVPNIEKFLNWAKQEKVETIIHCGDIAAPIMVKEYFAKFKGKVFLVFGNVADRELLPKICAQLKNVKLFGDQGEIDWRGIKIAFCHFPEQARELAQSGKYNFVFFGHTHKPGLEKIGNCFLVNPGTLAGLFQRASFAVYDHKNQKLELKILDELK